MFGKKHFILLTKTCGQIKKCSYRRDNIILQFHYQKEYINKHSQTAPSFQIQCSSNCFCRVCMNGKQTCVDTHLYTHWLDYQHRRLLDTRLNTDASAYLQQYKYMY